MMKQLKCSECGKEYDYRLKACPHCGYTNNKIKVIKIIFYLVTIILFIFSICSFLKYIYINNFINGLNEFATDEVDKQFATNIQTVAEAYQTIDYMEKYGSKEYGITAYNLNNFRIWSISICIAFIWLGIYLQHKNIKLGKILKYIAIVVFVICQLIPLGFDAIVRYKSGTPQIHTNITSNYDSDLIPIKEP